MASTVLTQHGDCHVLAASPLHWGATRGRQHVGSLTRIDARLGPLDGVEAEEWPTMHLTNARPQPPDVCRLYRRVGLHRTCDVEALVLHNLHPAWSNGTAATEGGGQDGGIWTHRTQDTYDSLANTAHWSTLPTVMTT